MCENPKKFYLQRLHPESSKVQRPDIRLTVDYPEDLIVAREVYEFLKKPGEYINVADIIDYMDAYPKLKELNGWIDAGIGRIWN